jgi:hypothetical protein
VNTDALMLACTPALAFIGSAIAYYAFTNSGDDDPSPVVRRGEVENEPWGIPYSIKAYRLPGDTIRRSFRDAARNDTRHFAKIIDTEGNEDATT